MHLNRFALVGIATALLLPLAPSAADAHDRHRNPPPSTIDLPPGFAGEGVASGDENTFYAGSLADGRIARGNLRAGTTEVFVTTPLVAPSVGLKADLRHDLLWVAGGPTGKAAVYDLDTGNGVVALTLTTAPSFINDVTVTRAAAYFTNSRAAEIYRVPVSRNGNVAAPETITLTGPAAVLVPGFNLNGIAASKDGRTLILVNSAKGELYAVDSATGSSATIDLGGISVAGGDGLLLDGRTLYVLQNGTAPGTTNQISVIRLDRRYGSGKVIDTITSDLFETATTLAKLDDALVAVNAQFAGAPVDPESEVVVLPLDD
jgi:sugar lactone lactonase YvrE